MPPVPMTARVRTSLGGVNPAPPRTCRGTMVRVVSEAMEVFRKVRRLKWWRLFMECLLSCFHLRWVPEPTHEQPLAAAVAPKRRYGAPRRRRGELSGVRGSLGSLRAKYQNPTGNAT